MLTTAVDCDEDERDRGKPWSWHNSPGFQVPDGQPAPFVSPFYYMYSDRKKLCTLCLKSYTARQAESCVISYYLMLDSLYGLIKYVLGDCDIPLYMCLGLLLKQNTACVTHAYYTLLCVTHKCYHLKTFCICPFYFIHLKGRTFLLGPKFKCPDTGKSQRIVWNITGRRLNTNLSQDEI